MYVVQTDLPVEQWFSNWGSQALTLTQSASGTWRGRKGWRQRHNPQDHIATRFAGAFANLLLPAAASWHCNTCFAAPYDTPLLVLWSQLRSELQSHFLILRCREPCRRILQVRMFYKGPFEPANDPRDHVSAFPHALQDLGQGCPNF